MERGFTPVMVIEQKKKEKKRDQTVWPRRLWSKLSNSALVCCIWGGFTSMLTNWESERKKEEKRKGILNKEKKKKKKGRKGVPASR